MYEDLVAIYTQEDIDLDRDEAAWLLLAAQEMKDVASNAVRKLSDYLADLLDEDLVLESGWVCQVKSTPSRTKFRKPALWAEVERIAGRNLRTGDGEVVTALDRRMVEQLCDVKTGNQRVWSDVGVDLDEFCTVAWTQTAKVVKP